MNMCEKARTGWDKKKEQVFLVGFSLSNGVISPPNSTFGFHIRFPLVLSLLSTIWHWSYTIQHITQFHNVTLNFHNTSCFYKCHSCYTFPAIRHTSVAFYASWFCLFHFFLTGMNDLHFKTESSVPKCMWAQTNKYIAMLGSNSKLDFQCSLAIPARSILEMPEVKYIFKPWWLRLIKLPGLAWLSNFLESFPLVLNLFKNHEY